MSGPRKPYAPGEVANLPALQPWITEVVNTSKFANADFVGWDGEGYTDNDGKHHYIILANSRGNSIVDTTGHGLSTTQCFEFLLGECADSKDSFHVIFAGGYDANKILRDLAYSPQRLRKLWETSQCFYKHYHIEWVKGKWLKIRDTRNGRKITLFDVFSFFQTSFVKTLKAWDISVDGSNMDTITRMKNERGRFSLNDRKEMLAYCFLELGALVSLMQKFRENHLKAGLPNLSGFYGPGAIANGLFKHYNVCRSMLPTDGELNEATRHAYSAGRIERLRYGNHEGPVRIYDINSAYPWSISRLPSLKAGWRKTRTSDVVPMSLYHIRLFHFDEYAGPLFYRKGLAKHRPIYFPNPKADSFIEHWVWTPEYELLVDFGIPHEVVKSYVFQGDFVERPFGFIENLYYTRLENKRLGNPAEKNQKLAMNSGYGKFVQQAGWQRKQEIPKFHQLEWGGYVTSETRAKLYRAIHSIGFRGVVGMETDSIIVADQPGGQTIPKVPLSDKLGEWGVTTYQGVTYIQSGVYWLKGDKGWDDSYSKRRGYVKDSLSRDAVLEAWNENPYGIDSDERQKWMVVNAQGNDFITLGHCFRPGQDFSMWGDWITGPKKLSLWKSTKRAIVRSENPALQLLDTRDETDFSGWSSPYQLEWIKE